MHAPDLLHHHFLMALAAFPLRANLSSPSPSPKYVVAVPHFVIFSSYFRQIFPGGAFDARPLHRLFQVFPDLVCARRFLTDLAPPLTPQPRLSSTKLE